jgi:hypothetical protein
VRFYNQALTASQVNYLYGDTTQATSITLPPQHTAGISAARINMRDGVMYDLQGRVFIKNEKRSGIYFIKISEQVVKKIVIH